MNRAEVLTYGARAGAALVIGGSALGVPSVAAAAEPASDADLAYVRLLVGVELLAIDFYSRAIVSNEVDGDALRNMKHALANEKVHYTSLSTVLAGAGQVAASADDIDFTYPGGTFASAAAIGKIGLGLEKTALGAYLGAVDGLQSNTLKRPFAQIAANEAQHLSALSSAFLGRPIGKAFASAMTIDEVTNVLDDFES